MKSNPCLFIHVSHVRSTILRHILAIIEAMLKVRLQKDVEKRLWQVYVA